MRIRDVAATLVGAALSVAIGLDPAPNQVDDSVPMQIGEMEPAPTVQAIFSNTLGGGVTVDTVLSASELVQTQKGEIVRILSATTTCHVGQVILEQSHMLHPVAVGSAEPLTVVVGPFEPGLGSALAAELLGETDMDELENLISSGGAVSGSTLTLAPSSETQSWGAVVVDDDITLSMVPLRD